MRIIAGLGNPGEKYNKTRHNIGFMFLDFVAQNHDLSWHDDKKFNALVTKHEDLILVKPSTFMNNSGQSIQAILSYYKLLSKKFGIINKKDSDLSQVLTVIHDDLDIELGKYKVSTNSRSAGHNGVQSIINHLKTKNFKRIRIGIKGTKPNKMPTEKFVLGKFSPEELETIKNNFLDIFNTLD